MSLYLGTTPIANISSQTVLNDKANINLSNLSSVGKALASSLGMPSDRYINLTLGASNAEYTAPANGYIFFSKDRSGSSNQYGLIIADDGVGGEVGYAPVASGYGVNIIRPIRKGVTFTVRYTLTGTTNYFRFVYAEGENV